ncbi:MAG: hypothetical protein HOP12_04350 [Candidatus Eisenbacteria bacterium]|uniref:Polymer-forming cytoskeletal protein n=1 Tax=Eiseniibacteriota bacterium TaxID=2212470 RepID=A0A849SLC3_UNCEI|nr:hypothetical protein [Candidatus Eisenbacteria bacterium]
MSKWSDSDRGLTRRLSAVGFGSLVLLALWCGAAFASRVRVSPAGVVVDQADSSSDSAGVHVSFDGHPGVHLDLDDNGRGIVRMWSDVRVGPGEIVDGDVVTIFGSALIEGHVTGEVVAVLGSIRLEPNAEIDGDAVSVGGGVWTDDSASIGGQTVSIGLLPVAWGMPALPWLLLLFGLKWLVLFVVGAAFAALFPQPFVRVAQTASRRTGLSLLVGVLSGPATLFAAVLLMVTVIGIPLGLILPIVMIFLSVAGWSAASYVLGCKLVRRPIGSGSLIAPLLAGSAFVVVFFLIASAFAVTTGVTRAGALFFGLLGMLLTIGLCLIGTGAMLLSRLGRTPGDASPAPLGDPLGAMHASATAVAPGASGPA